MLQAFSSLPKFDDSYTVIGSWVVGDVASGIASVKTIVLLPRTAVDFCRTLS
ncbi:Similarity with glutathionylspermidine synthase (EC 6.3.1.8), group 1 [Pseudomonas sp. FEN]|nr:Similarity with glutathionylspermidine synthase (EC 6.3.1.8), group 1 [Pseudomonas sp. FEN]